MSSKNNYGYVNARIGVKKRYLLKKDDYLRLSLMDPHGISNFMGQSTYQKEISELATMYSGTDLIERATYKNLVRVANQIYNFSTGEAKDLYGHYLASFDVYNIKTIMRGCFHHATEEEIMSEVIDAGVLFLKEMKQLAVMESIEDIIEGLRGKEYYEPLKDALAYSVDKDNNVITLLPLEHALEKAYYSNLLMALRSKRSRSRNVFIKYVRSEIDTKNIITLLKLKWDADHAGTQPPLDQMKSYLLEGGKELKPDTLNILLTIKGVRAFIVALEKYSIYGSLQPFLDMKESEFSINDIIRECEKYHLKRSEDLSKGYPLSILPVVHYTILKTDEVDNLRIIARGIETGLSTEVIRKLLVV